MEVLRVVIRCEQCSTYYELDEGVLAPEGSEVQCARCRHVFTVRPSRATAEQPAAPKAPTTPQAQVATPQAQAASPQVQAASAQAQAASPQAPAVSPAFTPGPAAAPPAPAPSPAAAAGARQAARSGPTVYRPAPTAGGVARPAGLNHDVVGTFEGRLRRSARWKWLAPALVLGVLALSAGTWYLFTAAPRLDPAVERARHEGLAALALDDAASIDRAAARLDAAVKGAPGVDAVAAERALVDVIRATDLLDEAGGLSARAARLTEERDRLRAAASVPAPPKPGAPPPPPPPDPGAAAGDEADALTARAARLERQASQSQSAATHALDRLDPAGPGGPEIARARALLAVLAGNDAALEQQLAAARAGGREDGWVDLAAVQSLLRAGADEKRAAAELSSLVKRHPELLRARLLLVRTQVTAGRRAEALGTLDSLLAANPRHEAAKALRAQLSQPAQAELPPPGPVAKPSPPTRNALSHPESTTAAPAGAPGAPASAPGARTPASEADPAAAAAAQPGPAPAAAPTGETPPRPPRPRPAPAAAPVPSPEPVGERVKEPDLGALP